MFKPPKPRFGDVVEVSHENWAAWTGGEPKPDWSGLANPNPKAIRPNQYRANSISGQAKSQVYRVAGLEDKFSRTSDLQTFERKVMKHLIQHGLDTITYLVDPTDKTKVVSVIEHHAKFTVKAGSVSGNMLMSTMYDGYDLENVQDAKDFLTNSLDSDLEKQLNQNCKDDDSFVAWWLELIHIVKTVSFDRFDAIKDRLKARKPSDYAGEDIESLVTDYLSDWKELHSAGLYDQSLTLTMLNTIMDAGGTTNEDFRFPLRSTKIK